GDIALVRSQEVHGEPPGAFGNPERVVGPRDADDEPLWRHAALGHEPGETAAVLTFGMGGDHVERIVGGTDERVGGTAARVRDHVAAHRGWWTTESAWSALPDRRFAIS